MSFISDNPDPPVDQDSQLGESLDADLEYLRSVGLNPLSSLTMLLPTPEGNVDQLQSLTDAIKALAWDMSRKIDSL